MTESDWSHYRLWHGIYGEPEGHEVETDENGRYMMVVTFPNGARFAATFITVRKGYVNAPHIKYLTVGYAPIKRISEKVS